MAKASKSAKEETKIAASGDGKQHYQEWEVKVTSSKNEDTNKVTHSYEKLKIRRPVVKITDEQAEVLNAGVLTGGNNYARMYFLPE